MFEHTTKQGYRLALKKWKRDAGEVLDDQTSFRNLSVFNTKGTSSAIAKLYPEVISGTDERRHTKYSNPAHSAAAGLERLWFYEKVAKGEAGQGTWWIDYVNASNAHAQDVSSGGIANSLNTSFRTAICVFTPPTDCEGSDCNLTGLYNNPNSIVNSITKGLLSDGFDFDPDNRSMSEYFAELELLSNLVEDWAKHESAIIWDANVFLDGMKIFQAMLLGERID